jgi:hypothetical protein
MSGGTIDTSGCAVATSESAGDTTGYRATGSITRITTTGIAASGIPTADGEAAGGRQALQQNEQRHRDLIGALDRFARQLPRSEAVVIPDSNPGTAPRLTSAWHAGDMRSGVLLRAVIGVATVVLGFARSAAAQQPASVRLDYERKEGAGSCPDADLIATSVAERLGYEPFDSTAPDTMKVTIFKKERGLQAKIEMVGSDGKSKAERVLSSRRSDCSDLAATMALAIAIAIDPFHANAPQPANDARPAPPPEPAPMPAPAPPAAKERAAVPAAIIAAPPPPRASPVSPRTPITARAGAGVTGGIGSAPVRNLGATISVGVRRANLSIDLEGRADLPASVPLRVGEVSTSLLVASLVPCVHWKSVAGCGLVTGGALRQVVDPYVALGARVALELRVASQLYLTAHADVSAPLVTTELRVGGDEFWTTPAIAILVGLGLGFAFP